MVAPNSIALDVAVDGLTASGCAPLQARIINNSSGANLFQWDFGDNVTYNSTKNAEVILHTYTQPGNYQISYRATNGCSDTSGFEEVQVFRTPKPAFQVGPSVLCIGKTISLVNKTDTATAYNWYFGDGAGSSLREPTHSYALPGLYKIVMVASMQQPNGIVCTDSTSQNIIIRDSLPGDFGLSDSVLTCKPFNVNFTNRNLPSANTTWSISDGTILTGDNVSHTFLNNGVYNVRMTSVAPGGCTYQADKQITATSPVGTLSYIGGAVCAAQPVRFEATVYYTDSLRWDFGDGTIKVTTDRVVYHTSVSYTHLTLPTKA